MFWNYAKTLSITNRLLIIFIGSIGLILCVVTSLIYPPMQELLFHARQNHEQYSYLLTQICIKKFFIALWASTLVLIGASYLLAKKSIKPIKDFTQELAAISISSLSKRLRDKNNPRELQELAITCNDLLFRIENAFGQMKQFSASMAHELRNPIHYLQTATEITLAKPQTIDTYQHLLQTHLETYHHLNRLIDNLLFLTRCERHSLPLTLTRLSANALISLVIEYYHAIASESGITVKLVGDAEIYVDEHLFKRVISNLIDNGITYNKQGGIVLIAISTAVDGQVKIEIKDSGIGIPKEHLPLLCEGFYRVNPHTHSDNAGLGLGLAIAKSIVEHHHGALLIESQFGVGTEVILTLKSIPSV